MADDDILVDVLDGAEHEGYTWEGEYQRTWNVIREDESGSLEASVAALQQQQKRKRVQRDTRSVRRGIIRHLFLVVDMSRAMEEKDLAPTRAQMTLTLLESFVTEFFDQNPISQLGVIVTRDASVKKLTDLSGNPAEHIRALRENATTSGEPSLQKSLDLAQELLGHVPRHGSREVVVLLGSLTTCDPGNIFTTIDQLKADGVRCSVIGLAAEVHVCRRLCEATGGTYDVIMNDAHYKEALFEHIHPPPLVGARSSSALVMMGFPVRKKSAFAAMCACHHTATRGGFMCPRCRAIVCDLPMDCPVCGLTLISSPHLARSYHHLFPVHAFAERKDAPPNATCHACGVAVGRGESIFTCGRCNNAFCSDCDIYIHDVLHNCPGCLLLPS